MRSATNTVIIRAHHKRSSGYEFSDLRVLELMRSLAFSTFLAGILLCSVLLPSTAFAQASSGDVVMVLSFENISNRPEYNWVGESFADSLTELLNKPGLLVISSNERAVAYKRVGLPLTMIPSRATSIKLAREAKATMIVLGTYSITPPKSPTRKPQRQNQTRTNQPPRLTYR